MLKILFAYLLKYYQVRNDLFQSIILYSCARSKFLGVSGSEDRGGGDSCIQFINFGRVGDKSFKEWRQKIGGWKGG